MRIGQYVIEGVAKKMDKQTIKEKLDLIIARMKERKDTVIEAAKPEETAEQTIRIKISKYWIAHDFYTADEIEKRFEIPPQFSVFLQYYGPISQRNGWRFMMSWQGIIMDTTRYWYNYFSDYKEEYRANGQYPMMLLDIGGWSDKHWYFISCDKEHHFGKVYEAYDTDFFDIPRIVDEEWPDFLTFLEREF